MVSSQAAGLPPVREFGYRSASAGHSRSVRSGSAIRLGVGITVEGVVLSLAEVEFWSRAYWIYCEPVCMCMNVPRVAGEIVGRFTLMSCRHEYGNFVSV